MTAFWWMSWGEKKWPALKMLWLQTEMTLLQAVVSHTSRQIFFVTMFILIHLVLIKMIQVNDFEMSFTMIYVAIVHSFILNAILHNDHSFRFVANGMRYNRYWESQQIMSSKNIIMNAWLDWLNKLLRYEVANFKIDFTRCLWKQFIYIQKIVGSENYNKYKDVFSGTTVIWTVVLYISQVNMGWVQ